MISYSYIFKAVELILMFVESGANPRLSRPQVPASSRSGLCCCASHPLFLALLGQAWASCTSDIFSCFHWLYQGIRRE